MDIDKHQNFTEVAAVPGDPFFHDTEGRLSMAVVLELEEIKALLDGEISVGVSKPSQDNLALSLAVAARGNPLFVRRMVLDLEENGKELAEYADGEKQLFSFFYRIEDKNYYALTTSVRFTDELKDDFRRLMRDDHPALHKIPLSQIDINGVTCVDAFMYRDPEMTEPLFLHEYLLSRTKNEETVTVWWGIDNKGRFVISSEDEVNGVQGKPCDPLKSGAMPYGSCSHKEAVIFIIDKKGFSLLCEHGNKKAYEKNYHFWR